VRSSRIDHVGITVAGADRALGFYRDALGMRVLGDVRLRDADTAALLGVDDVDLRIVDLDSGDGRIVELLEYARPAGKPMRYASSDSGTAHVAFTVDDLDSIASRIEAAGGSVISRRAISLTPSGGPFDGAKVLYVRDPDGMIVELVQRSE
jgi:catechol 2,3-dioxygenase-like lactoylglutathione lyase family enzyme